MKLRLAQEKGVEVVSASGPILSQDALILRAGLSKILKTGKNKIVLELLESPDLSSDVIREIAAFDALARELSGRIVLAGVSPVLKTKIDAFAKPPVILCFETKANALDVFTAPPVPEIASAIPVDPAAASELQGLKNEEQILKSRMRELEKENKRLKEQVVLATLARRPPVDEKDYLQKIDFLEAKLEKILSEAVEPKKK